MSYANLTDVSARLGRPITTPEEIAQVNAWLGDVHALIMSRIPDLDPLAGAGPPSFEVVVMVEANAVIRKVQNPEGKVSEGIDDYNYRLNENARKGEVFLTEEEWALLLRGTNLSGAFSTRPGFEPDTVSLVWP